MGLSYLLETSVITLLGRPEVAGRVLTLGGAIRMRSSMTDLDVGFSASNAAEWDMLQTKLSGFALAEVTAADFASALALQRALATAGLKGRKLPDLLNAAVALRLDVTLLHYDRGFEYIATVSDLKHEWVIPAGTL